jgi:predicted heme/steroid binding protein
MKEFSAEELAKYNGQNGNPAYVAYRGDVYDVSDSKLWRTGMHMKRHHAGRDLTTDIQAAPHEPDILNRYPKVGRVKKEAEEPRVPAALAGLIKKYPMLQRHPHPMTVHFPIAFAFSPPVFIFLYLITGVKSFEITALNCLGAGILFTAVAIATGFYTWWLNYLARMMGVLKKKNPPGICDADRRNHPLYLATQGAGHSRSCRRFRLNLSGACLCIASHDNAYRLVRGIHNISGGKIDQS